MHGQSTKAAEPPARPHRGFDESVHLRPQEPGDENYILDTWKKSAGRSHGSDRRRHSREPAYYRGMDQQIELALTHPRSRVLVAASPLDRTHILGWLAWADTAPPVIHWVYVRHRYRSRRGLPMGLAWYMMASVGITRESSVLYTFATPRARTLAKKFNQAEILPLTDFAESGVQIG